MASRLVDFYLLTLFVHVHVVSPSVFLLVSGLMGQKLVQKPLKIPTEGHSRGQRSPTGLELLPFQLIPGY